ncbi:DEAD/DEAH box helicase [Holdemanella biformis]|uniref:DEAD/DEAH box helicase n=1 Tax=Holdemanella biformis TaxID=1735 RepID=UPI002E765C85|nr:DEAD/DEAH box helicase [Holdemanella biformis]
MKYIAHDYQTRAVEWCLNNPRCGLFLPMGAGKTVITLSAIARLKQNGLIDKVLIIAPVRVARTTWPAEIEKWDHTKSLTYSVVDGDAKKRTRALEQDSDIYIIGKEQVVWLCETVGKSWPFDMVVVDELSTFKNNQAQRFKALKKQVKKFKRFIGLTGTPAPRGIPDLWSQMFLIDCGKRLGKSIGAFRKQYLIPERSNGYIVYSWAIRDGAQKEIEEKISDVVMSLDSSECVELPDINYINVPIVLPKTVKKRYDNFKKDLVLELSTTDVSASNLGVLCGQLLQFASGQIYTHDPSLPVDTIHDEKLKVLSDILTSANGEPVIIYYYYKHELDRIINLLESNNLRYSTLEKDSDLARWNNHELDVLLLHPASAGHGLNLQAGGSVLIWYTLPNFNLELYQQSNARLYRQGQREKVRVYHLLVDDSIDVDMMNALEKKDVTQSTLLEALRR